MVNTFVLTSSSFDPDFSKTASLLDKRRLGKQRVEAYQILNILNDLEFVGGKMGITFTQVDTDELNLPKSVQAEKYLERCLCVKNVIAQFRKNKMSGKYAFNTTTNEYFEPASTQKSENIRTVTLGFASHPAVRMWVGYTAALKAYTNAHIYEWIRRGFQNSMTVYSDASHSISPWWRNDAISPVCISHLFSLKRKEPESYTQLIVPENLEEWRSCGYCWPPNLNSSIITGLINGDRFHPSIVTVEPMKQ